MRYARGRGTTIGGCVGIGDIAGDGVDDNALALDSSYDRHLPQRLTLSRAQSLSLHLISDNLYMLLYFNVSSPPTFTSKLLYIVMFHILILSLAKWICFYQLAM